MKQNTSTLLGKARKAFTLIELLVVVVIIGILASIALPSFVGAQDKARNSSVTGNVNTARMALEQYSTDNNGSFPTRADWVGANKGVTPTGGSYLPGNSLPKAPWSTVAQTAAGFDAVFQTANNVASGSPLGLLAANPTGVVGVGGIVNATGVVKATAAPAVAADYGFLSYDYDNNTQTYVLIGTGKKNKTAIIAAQVSNNGN